MFLVASENTRPHLLMTALHKTANKVKKSEWIYELFRFLHTV